MCSIFNRFIDFVSILDLVIRASHLYNTSMVEIMFKFNIATLV